jgi:phosphopantothenoylcysteine decarboxylase/phosphopantothenate--cysteine ligase
VRRCGRRLARRRNLTVKLKKRNTAPTLALVENPDILAGLSTHASLRPKLVIGFAAETDELIANAPPSASRRAATGSSPMTSAATSWAEKTTTCIW